MERRKIFPGENIAQKIILLAPAAHGAKIGVMPANKKSNDVFVAL